VNERARARTRAVPTHAYVMHRLREVELCSFKGSYVALRAHTICNTQVEHTLNEQARQLACMQVCAVCALVDANVCQRMLCVCAR